MGRLAHHVRFTCEQDLQDGGQVHQRGHKVLRQCEEQRSHGDQGRLHPCRHRHQALQLAAVNGCRAIVGIPSDSCIIVLLVPAQFFHITQAACFMKTYPPVIIGAAASIVIAAAVATAAGVEMGNERQKSVSSHRL